MDTSKDINNLELNCLKLRSNDIDINLEFTSLPTVKGKVINEKIESDFIEYEIFDFSDKISILCDKYSLSVEEFCFSLWGIILKLYNYDNYSKFITISSNDSINIRTITSDKDNFSSISEQIKKDAISVDEYSLLYNYKNKVIVEFIDKNIKLQSIQYKRNFIKNDNSIQVRYIVFENKIKMFLYCNKNVINKDCLDAIGFMQNTIIHELLLGKIVFQK